MRSLIVIFATLALSVAVISGIDTTPNNGLETSILNLLTRWRAGDRGPFSFPLPTLDEIIIPEVSGNYAGYGVKIAYATSELKLVGLKNFEVQKLNASESKLTASITITAPRLILSSDKYDVKGKALWFINVKGSGNMSVIFTNNEVTFSIQLRNSSSRTCVDSLQLAFKLGGVKANLQNGPNSVSSVLNEFGVSILQSNHEDIVKTVRDLMVPTIDEFLQNMTPEQLFFLISDWQTTPNVKQVKR